MATFTLQAATSVLDEGTSPMCCVAISGLPDGGLGCDIDVQLDVSDITTGILITILYIYCTFENASNPCIICFIIFS